MISTCRYTAVIGMPVQLARARLPRSIEQREPALKERTYKDDQPKLQSYEHPQQSSDLALDQEQFDQWLASKTTSDDVRNRIAVAGNTISRGAFGKCYLLGQDKALIVSTDTIATGVVEQQHGEVANDTEFQPVVAQRTR